MHFAQADRIMTNAQLSTGFPTANAFVYFFGNRQAAKTSNNKCATAQRGKPAGVVESLHTHALLTRES